MHQKTGGTATRYHGNEGITEYHRICRCTEGKLYRNQCIWTQALGSTISTCQLLFLVLVVLSLILPDSHDS
jgi:hypothetical protein